MATYRLTCLNKARVAEAARGLFQIDQRYVRWLRPLHASDRVDCSRIRKNAELKEIVVNLKCNTQSAREKT